MNQAGGFRAFIPKPLPPNPPLDAGEKTQALLAKAERNLGRLDGLSLLVPDPDRFVRMYIRQEAVLSSQIEGTQASLADLLEYEASENEAERTIDIGRLSTIWPRSSAG
ncbi:MAG: Fic/DOC family N-terminal domain-containing protein [Planctomycetota bacterium]